jgi:hypothetical protein
MTTAIRSDPNLPVIAVTRFAGRMLGAGDQRATKIRSVV